MSNRLIRCVENMASPSKAYAANPRYTDVSESWLRATTMPSQTLSRNMLISYRTSLSIPNALARFIGNARSPHACPDRHRRAGLDPA